MRTAVATVRSDCNISTQFKSHSSWAPSFLCNTKKLSVRGTWRLPNIPCDRLGKHLTYCSISCDPDLIRRAFGPQERRSNNLGTCLRFLNRSPSMIGCKSNLPLAVASQPPAKYLDLICFLERHRPRPYGKLSYANMWYLIATVKQNLGPETGDTRLLRYGETAWAQVRRGGH